MSEPQHSSVLRREPPERVERVSAQLIETLERLGAEPTFLAALRAEPPRYFWRDAQRAWKAVRDARIADVGWLAFLNLLTHAIAASIRLVLHQRG